MLPAFRAAIIRHERTAKRFEAILVGIKDEKKRARLQAKIKFEKEEAIRIYRDQSRLLGRGFI